MSTQQITTLPERQKCGFYGHACSDRVLFISRYHDQSDYCLDGKRLTVHDDGVVYSTSGVTDRDLSILETFFRKEHEDYLCWRKTQAFLDGQPEPEYISHNLRTATEVL